MKTHDDSWLSQPEDLGSAQSEPPSQPEARPGEQHWWSNWVAVANAPAFQPADSDEEACFEYYGMAAE